MSAEVDTVSYTVLVPADVKLYKKTCRTPSVWGTFARGFVPVIRNFRH